MDEFTRACFMPTCRMQSLHAQRYEQQLLDNPPDLLFVESAWRGEADSWRNMVASRSGELLGLLDMCRRRHIPTVFWNKEDPSHFDTFIDTARLFDHVFTTDIDCIQRYRDALGHDRVHLLPFACQPRIHHPVYDGTRQAGFCFAGSYYRQYPERCEDFDRVLSAVAGLAPVVIHDRNSERGDSAFEFPERYAPMLRPSLPYDRIDEAYKGYRFSINMNTIKQSQTMFARRVYELMASNTIVVSNYSRGMRSLFGDLAVASDRPQRIRGRLQTMIDTPDVARRLRLLALRKVMQQHTCAQRMQHVAATVLGESMQLIAPFVVAVAQVDSEAEATAVCESHSRQLHHQSRLLLVAAEGLVIDGVVGANVEVIRRSDAALLEPARDFAGHYLALLHPHDYYGAHYLSDMVLAIRYSDADVIGKGAFYRNDGGKLRLLDGPRYKSGAVLQPRASIVRCSTLGGTLVEWLNASDSATSTGLAIDEFSYCRDGVDAGFAVDVSADGLDIGADIEEVMRRAEALPHSTSDRRARRPAGRSEINAMGADFRGVLPRSHVLFVADSLQQLGSGGGIGDSFLFTEAAPRSFVETDSGEIMQGGSADLHDLLATRSYTTVCARAPGDALCKVIAVHAASHALRIALSAVEVASATPGLLALLRAGYPRLKLILDDLSAADALVSAFGQPVPPGLCEILRAG